MPKNSVKSSTQDFSKVVHANTPRSTFKRVSTLATTFNAGDLVPIYVDEILPGDTFKMDLQFVSRLLTPIVPVMDNFNVEFFAFFVPNRIVWNNWQALMGENNSSAWTPTTPPASVPSAGSSNTTLSSKGLGDYYGLPVGMNLGNHSVNVLPFRGYYQIWNDWFRNQNVQAPFSVVKGDTGYIYGTTGSPALNNSLLKVNKPFDYFTSALPAPQKGLSQLIPIELNTLIPVIAGTSDHTSGSTTTSTRVRSRTNGNLLTNANLVTNGAGAFATQAVSGAIGVEGYFSNLYADGTGLQISGSTINDLRTAFQIQRLYERDARGGTRYIEMLKAHFGVDAGDYRLQRPEYLGHCSTLMDITQVTQTSATETGVQATDLGTTGAYGHAQGDKSLFEKSFVEHGFIHIFAVARQKKTYQQGLDRFWTRRDRLDYYVPVLAHISEQPIYQSEIYALTANAGTVFGYQEAWSDYRYKPSRVTGQMRSGVTNSFDIWHYADIYEAAPTLSDGWMQDNSEVNIQRTLAVADADQILLNVRFDLEATRPMPTHSIPGLIDHF